MDFGLSYAEMLDQIVLSEALGFGECWFAEHHFTDYSILPSPNLMIAAALGRTGRMRFGNYVNALPLHHPLRLAAEAAMLDNLARGRFDFGIGKGVRPGEFAKLGVPWDDAAAMTEEAIEILGKVWTQKTASHDGKFWRFPELSLRPRPFQRPTPPLRMVASRPASAARVGARGWPVAMHFTPTEVWPAAWRNTARRWPPGRSSPARDPTARDFSSAARPTWPRRPRKRGRRGRSRSRASGISPRWPRRRCPPSSRTRGSRS